MKIKVKVETNQDNDYFTFDLDDIGMSEKEWNKLSNEEKHEKLDELVGDLPEQPYWMVDTFSEDE